MERPQAWRPQKARSPSPRTGGGHGSRRKNQLRIDDETLEIRAVEITESNIGDARVLPDLLSRIPLDEVIGSVPADGADDSRKCHDAIANRGVHAVIPPREDATP